MDNTIRAFVDQALGIGVTAAFGLPGPAGAGAAAVIQTAQLFFDIFAGAGNPPPAIATSADLHGVESNILTAIKDTAFTTALQKHEGDVMQYNDVLVEAVTNVALKSTSDLKDSAAQHSWDVYQKKNLTKFYGSSSPVMKTLDELTKLSPGGSQDYAKIGAYVLAATTHIAFCKFAMTMEWNDAVDTYRATCRAVEDYNTNDYPTKHTNWAAAHNAGQKNIGAEPAPKDYPKEPEPWTVLPGGPAYVSIQTNLPVFIDYTDGIISPYRKAFDQRARNWDDRQKQVVTENNGDKWRFVDKVTNQTSAWRDKDDFDDAYDAHIGQLYDAIMNTDNPIRIGTLDISLGIISEDDLAKFEQLVAGWRASLADYPKVVNDDNDGT